MRKGYEKRRKKRRRRRRRRWKIRCHIIPYSHGSRVNLNANAKKCKEGGDFFFIIHDDGDDQVRRTRVRLGLGGVGQHAI